MSYSALSIVLVSNSFLAYLYISLGTEKWLLKKFGNGSGQSRHILFNRILGLLLFGFVPLLLFGFFSNLGFKELGLGNSLNTKTLLLTLGIIVLPVVVNFFAARTPDNLAMYPQIRTKKWDKALLMISALSWTMYLLGYEIMLRGVLFFSCLAEMNLVWAIAINTSIYALIHIPKGMKETLGSIPMGIVLCLITYYTGSIWSAFFIHCSLALSNEWFSLKFSKEIVIK